MAHIIEVEEHALGAVSVMVYDTGGGLHRTNVYERHGFSDMKTAFDYGNVALQMYLARVDAE